MKSFKPVNKKNEDIVWFDRSVSDTDLLVINAVPEIIGWIQLLSQDGWI